jgi:hypothetical protein
MIHELREYRLNSGGLAPYIDLVRDRMLPLRSAVPGRLVGFFTSGTEGLDRIVHLWEYDSLDARQAARSALAVDDEWCTGFVVPALPYIASQRVSFLDPIEQRKPLPGAAPAVYLLRRWHTGTGRAPEVCQRLIQQRGALMSEPLFSYLSISPEANCVLQLLRTLGIGPDSLHVDCSSWADMGPDAILDLRTEVLFPTAVSPLQ